MGYKNDVLKWKAVPAARREEMLIVFPQWKHLRHREFFPLAAGNWLSKYLLSRCFKNKYDRYKNGNQLISLPSRPFHMY
jgi:hypothetical protein